MVWRHNFGADLLYRDGALYFDGSAKILALTDDATFSSTYDPAISGERVVRVQDDGNDWEIMLWDRSGWDGTVPVTPIPMTNNDYDDASPVIDGPYVGWAGRKGGGDLEIFLWDGTFPIAVQQLTNDGRDGERVVWSMLDEVGGDHDIAMTTIPEPDAGGALLAWIALALLLGARRPARGGQLESIGRSQRV